MKTIVLDDDPTGTQSASDVMVLLEWTVLDIVDALQHDDTVYIQTNSRALDEATAVALMRRLRSQIEEAEGALGGERLQIVLRGDSTLRGHVFPESDVFADGALPILLVPAFPEGGRRTIGSIHYLDVRGSPTPVAETEYADDPVFGYRSSSLVDYSREKGDRKATPVLLDELRDTQGAALRRALRETAGGDVVVPDVETAEDIELIAGVVHELHGSGVRIVVRGGAPIAAAIGRKSSTGLLEGVVGDPSRPVLVVCGSHTSGAAEQLEFLRAETGWEPIIVRTEAAFVDPAAEARRVAKLVHRALNEKSAAVIASERTRRAEDNTLEHGSRVMAALVDVVRQCPGISNVVTKGGITSAEVIGKGLGTTSAQVVGQIGVGISTWRTIPGAAAVVVVPGNVGGPDAIHAAVRATIGADELFERSRDQAERGRG